jgi:hypothetical protein
MMAEPEMEKIEIYFNLEYRTKKKTRYDEETGSQEFSDKGPAIGYIYPYTEAMELIGSPKRIKVTIEPA